MNTAGLPLWRLKSPEVQSVRVWEDGCVVYHALSGDTHYLTGLASRIYLRLAEAPAPLEGLVDREGGIGAAAAQAADTVHEAEAVLSELVKRGLIECT